MGFLFSKPKAPPPPPKPPAPDTSAEVARRMQEAAALERKARGRASTTLTGGQGLLDDEYSAKRILLRQ